MSEPSCQYVTEWDILWLVILINVNKFLKRSVVVSFHLFFGVSLLNGLSYTKRNSSQWPEEVLIIAPRLYFFSFCWQFASTLNSKENSSFQKVPQYNHFFWRGLYSCSILLSTWIHVNAALYVESANNLGNLEVTTHYVNLWLYMAPLSIFY